MTQSNKLLEAVGAAELHVTPDLVDSMIRDKTFVLQPCKTVMVCTITLHNGFRLFGYNTTLNPADFDLKQGEERSFNEARNQVFAYAAYQILEDKFRGNAPLSQAQRELPDHLQRVIREYFQLMSRLTGLTMFLEEFAKLSPTEVEAQQISAEEILDLQAQEKVMVQLSVILQRRLARAGQS